MSHTIPFTKMHGAGNDYIYVNTLLYNVPDPAATAISWSAPHTGIGSDGLVLIGYADTPEADYSMRIFNADGSEAMMCGNASRCIGKYLYEKGITDKTMIRLQTRSGIKRLNLHVSRLESNKNDEERGATGEERSSKREMRSVVDSVTVDMLEPRTNVKELFLAASATRLSHLGDGVEAVLTAGDRTFSGTFVSMGNPHFVVFTDHLAAIDIPRYGRLLEHHEAFPQRCNIEFAQITNTNSIRTRVWERGSGITMACGTGACATAVAAALTHRAGRESQIVMDGGTLSIEWRADNHVYMTGPAAFVFEGEAPLPPKD